MEHTTSLLVLVLHILRSLADPLEDSDNAKSSVQNGKRGIDDLFDFNLIEYTPPAKSLKTDRLLERMGKHFDSFWMSVEKPPNHEDLYVKGNLEHNRTTEKDYLAFNLTGLQTILAVNDTHDNSTITTVVSSVRDWLTYQTSCPVYYEWKDLGALYWPRWIRRGMCNAKEAKCKNAKPIKDSSCSWPPGMNCIPDKAKRLRVLRWQCQHHKAVFHTFPNPVFKGVKPHHIDVLKKTLGVSNVVMIPSSPHHDDDPLLHVWRREDDPNHTENWKRQIYVNIKRKPYRRCRWGKIPYPVTDDCYCSS
ncbi:noggin [Biomphalaria pfeifferi]|uniref:Noggin n=1 Tax=Biomphalaria pfeifferi TaxID=112525 RepID=A0AAD8AVH1_BIOPF|nr:noggin [Biomphalaria pfeifferi]